MPAACDPTVYLSIDRVVGHRGGLNAALRPPASGRMVHQRTDRQRIALPPTVSMRPQTHVRREETPRPRLMSARATRTRLVEREGEAKEKDKSND